MATKQPFWRTVWQSSTRPELYPSLASQTLGTSVWYLSRLLFCIAIFVTIWIGFAGAAVLPLLEAGARGVIKEMPALYPKGLVITVQSGALSMNRKNPVQIAMPATLTKVLTESGEDEGRTTPVPKFLVTIDTSKTTEDYAKLDTIVLATKQGLVVPDKDAGVRFIPYQRNIVVTDVKVNDLFARLDTVANAFSKIGKVAGFGLLLIIPFIIAAAMLAMWMFIALPIALVALCIAALMKRSWTYSEMYKACLYGATTVILLRLLFDWLPGTPHVPATLLLLWMIVVVSLSKKKRESK